MCSAVIACLTVAPQSVLLIVPGTEHTRGKEQYHPTEAVCIAGTAWRWEVEVLFSFNCTEVAKRKNSNILPSCTTTSEHTSVLVILEIKMGSNVSGAVHSIPPARFSAWSTSSHADRSTGPSHIAFCMGDSWMWQIYREDIKMEKGGNTKPLRKFTMTDYISQ